MSVAQPVTGRFVVALTGGIASGKTAATQRFAKLSIVAHDADLIARELVSPGRPALAEIALAFGAAILTPQGTLDRAALRARVFADPQRRRQLEAILHPRIRAELLARVQADVAAYSLLAIPLLVESGHAYDWINRVLVIDAREDVQRQRLLQRDGIDATLAGQMLAAQSDRVQRLQRADDVIENNGTLAQLWQAVDRLHASYLRLAGGG